MTDPNTQGPGLTKGAEAARRSSGTSGLFCRGRGVRKLDPSSALLPFLFWGEGSPAKVDYGKKEGWYPSSNQ